MYFIYGNELFLIEKEIKKILKQNDGANNIYINEDSTIYEVVNEINTFSIFDNKKIIIIKDFYLLNKNNFENEREIINSLKNKNENCIVIFTYLLNEKPKVETPLFEFLLNFAKTQEVKKYNSSQLPTVIQEIVESKNGKISNINSILLATKLPNDLNLIIREIDKLLLENNEITKEIIQISIGNYNSDNIFEFINSFQEKDVSGLFKSYGERIDSGESITNLMSQLANALILCTNIYSYKSSGIRLEEIAEKMKIHIFRIKKANELLKSFGIDKIKNLIEMLSTLDTNIKIGNVNETLGFEKLLLEIIR